ncbi:MAG: folate-binding protein YgfZ [Notoacmeibacter sp.]|nr:folate-binding protein YgfZ [Notoacmeibacter sp.]
MPFAHVPGRALVSVTGAEATHFLQNLVTTDMETLREGEIRPGALLTPQGKILFSFLVSRANGGFALECDGGIAEDFARRLMLYKLRAKVDISVKNPAPVHVCWGVDSPGSQDDSSLWLADARFPNEARVWRIHGPVATDGDLAGFDAVRIAHGIAEAGRDYADGDAFPHDAGLDQTGGVSFRKGCYVGQEVVSRMQHRGTARRRIVIVTADGALPPEGSDLLADGKPAGRLGTVSGRTGLALVRIDRVAEALATDGAVTAEGIALAIAVPPGASYALAPSASQDD